MKADKSDEKIPTRTIPSEAYSLSDISAFMGCRAHTKNMQNMFVLTSDEADDGPCLLSETATSIVPMLL